MTKLFSADEAGKVWKVKFPSLGDTIALGVTGELVKITAPAGQLVRLHSLSTTTTSNQVGISLGVDGEIVVPTNILSDESPSNSGFYISRAIGGSSVATGLQQISELIGDEITINKNAGNTAESIFYAYEFGVFE